MKPSFITEEGYNEKIIFHRPIKAVAIRQVVEVLETFSSCKETAPSRDNFLTSAV